MKHGNTIVEGAAEITNNQSATDTKSAPAKGSKATASAANAKKVKKVTAATPNSVVPTAEAPAKPAKKKLTPAQKKAKEELKAQAKAHKEAVLTERDEILNAPYIKLPNISEPSKDVVAKNLQKKNGHTFMNPLEIVIKWNDNSLARNPRQFYGTPTEWRNWKNNILDEGIKDPVRVYKGTDGRWYLRHGFRRLKAWHELRSAGAEVQLLIPVQEVSADEIEALRDHLTLNSALPLTDIEKAEGIRRYMKLVGGGKQMVAPIARELNIEYVKATQLFKFIQKAHSSVVQAMNEGILTLDVAKQIIKAAPTFALQAKLVAEGREKAKDTKTGKIRTYHITEVSKARAQKSTGNEESADSKVLTVLQDYTTAVDVDTDFVNRMLSVVDAILTGRNEKEIKGLMAPMQLAS